MVVAENAYPKAYPTPAYNAPSYPAPAYKAPAYPTPSYPAPAYKAQSYETYVSKSSLAIFNHSIGKLLIELQAPQPYSFGYEVKDEYYNNYGHQETSDGKTATGSYHVVLPDGRHQYVNYKADDYGYVADVTYQGEAKYDYKPAYKAPAAYPTPSYPAPAYKAPAYSAPAYKAPAYPKYWVNYINNLKEYTRDFEMYFDSICPIDKNAMNLHFFCSS